PVGPEHEVVDEQLAPPVEQVGERAAPVGGVELVGLVDAHPRQCPALPAQLIASARQLLLRLEQLEAGAEPFLAAGDGGFGQKVHWVLPSWADLRRPQLCKKILTCLPVAHKPHRPTTTSTPWRTPSLMGRGEGFSVSCVTTNGPPATSQRHSPG